MIRVHPPELAGRQQPVPTRRALSGRSPQGSARNHAHETSAEQPNGGCTALSRRRDTPRSAPLVPQLATGVAFELPQAILREGLNDFLLVKDDEIMQAMVWMIERAHTLVEAAGGLSSRGRLSSTQRVAREESGDYVLWWEYLIGTFETSTGGKSIRSFLLTPAAFA